MSWEQENERDPTVEDLLMINLFSTLQPAFEEFCKIKPIIRSCSQSNYHRVGNEKLSPDYDDLFKDLIIETSRIERRPSKKSKAQKDKGEVVDCHDC
jgi:hypothetical protein